MRSITKTAMWLALAAVLVAAVSDNLQAQTRVFRAPAVIRPNNVSAFRPAAQPFPTVGNPQWYRYTNWSGYSNPNNYVNYSYLNAAVNPYPYWNYSGYGYNPYAYNPYAYKPYAYSGYNPYGYTPNPYYTNGYAVPY